MKKIFVLLSLFSLVFLFACSQQEVSVDSKIIDTNLVSDDDENTEIVDLWLPKGFGTVTQEVVDIQNSEFLAPVVSLSREDASQVFHNTPIKISFNIPDSVEDKNLLTVVQVLDFDGHTVVRPVDSEISDDQKTITAWLEHFSNYTISQQRYGAVEIPEEIKQKLVDISQNPPEGAVEFYGNITYISNNYGQLDREAFSVHKGCKAKTKGTRETESYQISTSEHDGDCIYDPATDETVCEQGNALQDTRKISYQRGFDLSENSNCQIYDGEIKFDISNSEPKAGHFMAYTDGAEGKFQIMIDGTENALDENFIGELEGNIFGQGKLEYDFQKRPEVQIPLIDIASGLGTHITEGLILEGETQYYADSENFDLKLKILGNPIETERKFGPNIAQGAFDGVPKVNISKGNIDQDQCSGFGSDASDNPYGEFSEATICEEMMFSLILEDFLQKNPDGFIFQMPADDKQIKEFSVSIDAGLGRGEGSLEIKLTRKEKYTPEQLQDNLKVDESEIVTNPALSGPVSIGQGTGKDDSIYPDGLIYPGLTEDADKYFFDQSMQKQIIHYYALCDGTYSIPENLEPILSMTVPENFDFESNIDCFDAEITEDYLAENGLRKLIFEIWSYGDDENLDPGNGLMPGVEASYQLIINSDYLTVKQIK